MSNPNGMIRASEVLRMRRQLHKQIVLASIDHCPVEEDDAKLKELWQKFKPTDQDGDVVYKFLSRCGPTEDCLFSGSPWRQDVLPKWPTKFHSDPQAVLAFLSNERQIQEEFEVPQCFRDNAEAMIAICAKCPGLFILQASSRLHDDEDFVRAVLMEEKERETVILEVSQRLLQDKKMFFYAVRMGYCTPLFARVWLASLNYGRMTIQEQNEIGHAILRCLRHYEPCQLKQIIWALSKFSQELRDDASFMLPFVKLDWHALKYCSDRLRSNKDIVQAAVSQNINAYKYAKGPIRQEYQRKRTVDAVLGELDQGLYFGNVPKKLKTNKDIILTALKAGKRLTPLDFPDDLYNEEKFILDAIAAHHGNLQGRGYFYKCLPKRLQKDTHIAKALLKAGCPARVAILTNVPSLLQSREAMMDAVALPEGVYRGGNDLEDFPHLVGRCPFSIRDDEEFMLKAFKSNRDTFPHASERLHSNRDFVSAALALSHAHNLGYEFIVETTEGFQVQNVDLIVEAIEREKCQSEWYNDDDIDDDVWFASLNEDVWRNKNVVMACLQKGWSIEDDIPIDANSPILGDKEFMFLAIKNCPSDLNSSATAFREDREFILKLVTEIDSVLQHAPANMKYDKEILLAAVARSGGAICHCFDCSDIMGTDFEFLCEFASELRSAIATHKSFMELLRGIADPDCRSLSMLNLGFETEVALKKKIAEFAGIRFPMSAGLESLQAALSNMEKFGF